MRTRMQPLSKVECVRRENDRVTTVKLCKNIIVFLVSTRCLLLLLHLAFFSGDSSLSSVADAVVATVVVGTCPSPAAPTISAVVVGTCSAPAAPTISCSHLFLLSSSSVCICSCFLFTFR